MSLNDVMHRRAPFAGSAAAIVAVYAATLFLSAALLFSVQPMFAKMVLPRLGGAPSVWAVAMCFFQAVLLAGYCYAHVLIRALRTSWALGVHLGLLAVAFVALPIALPDDWADVPERFTQFWVLALFAAAVGLPFFAVSANAPLLQAWFARTGHPHGRDPYFLYGASNLGSLAVLIAYPVVIEPVIGLAVQSRLWSAGFALLAAAIAVCGLIAVRGGVGAGHSAAPVAAAAGERPSWPARLTWIGLAFVPSGLLVAFTTHITTDVASAPFLWVGPLALYLLTYVLVFRDPPYVSPKLMLMLQPVAAGLALVGMLGTGTAVWVAGVVGGVGVFFTTAMICHRGLYERRPRSADLTEFYLWMSLGGVLGGIFTALLAPVLFNVVAEYPLLIVLGLFCRADVWGTSVMRGLAANPARSLIVVAIAFAAAGLAGSWFGLGTVEATRLWTVTGLAGLAYGALVQRERVLAGVAMAVIGAMLLPAAASSSHTVRSFFGVHRVFETADGQFRLLSHGTTLHGARRIRTAEGAPVHFPVPATYYHPASPMAAALHEARRLKPTAEILEAGIVGLGSGAFACNRSSGEAWTFFEIDPVVVRIARDPAIFDYLAKCADDGRMVVGDARLTLAREAERHFDYLLIDAFSSDTVPVHLMTVEALSLFLSRVADDGLLVMHISNRFLDLAPVLEAAVAQIGGMHGVLITDRNRTGDYDAIPSSIVVMARDAGSLDGLAARPDARRFAATPVKPWTDDYSDILSALWRHFWK